MTFGAYIKSLREARGYSLAKAARELGMTSQRLCDIEQGRRNFLKSPPMALLKSIAIVYDHPFTNLVTNTEFFQYEKSVITDLLLDLEPVANGLEQKALEMLVESRQYTPEMETLATEAHSLTQDLKMALVIARTRYTKGPRHRTSDGSRRTKEGTNE